MPNIMHVNKNLTASYVQSTVPIYIIKQFLVYIAMGISKAVPMTKHLEIHVNSIVDLPCVFFDFTSCVMNVS